MSRGAEHQPVHLAFQLAVSGVMLPFLFSYFWFCTPRPDRFMPLLGIFGENRRTKSRADTD